MLLYLSFFFPLLVAMPLFFIVIANLRFCFSLVGADILLDPEQVLFSKCESPDCCTPAINTQKFCRVHASLKFIQNAAHAPVESNYSDS